MSQLGGLTPITITTTDTLLQLMKSIKPGEIVPTKVTGTGEQRQVVIAGVRVTLPSTATLVHGDSVLVRIEAGADGPRVIITPNPPAATSTGTNQPATLTSLSAVIQSVIQEVATLQSLNAHQASALSPSSLPPIAAVIRLALEVLQVNSIQTATQSRETLVQLLQGVANKGALSDSAQQVLSVLANDANVDQPQALERLIRSLHDQLQKAPLGTLQSAVTNVAPSAVFADPQATGLYHLLALIRNDPDLLLLIGSKADHQMFQSAVDVLQDHAAGQHLQNARGTEMPYLFMNLPLGSDFPRAQLHVLGGEGSSGKDASSEGTVILDLELSQLGNVWVELRHHEKNCTCRFHVESDQVATAILEASESLRARLNAGHFTAVEIQATTDSRDRIETLAMVLGGVAGLDVQA